MGRRRRASLWGRTGIRIDRGRRLPGFYVRYSHYGLDGQRIHHSEHFDTLSAARRFVRRYNARHDLELTDQTVPISLRDASREFLESCGALGKQTLIQYSAALTYLRLVVQERDVSSINGADIDRFTAERIDASSGPTAAKHLRGLNRFFVWAISRGYIAENPIRRAVSRPRTSGARVRPVIDDAGLERLVASCDTEDRRIAVWIAMSSGLDRGVIENLCAAQIDFAHRQVRLVRPKTGKKLTVPLHVCVLPFLSRRRDLRGPAAPLLDGIAVRDWWPETLRRARLPETLWFRDLRAVASSWLQRIAKLSLTDVQKLLGHSSPTVTAAHYSDLHPDVATRFHESSLPGARPAPAPKPEKRSRGRGSESRSPGRRRCNA